MKNNFRMWNVLRGKTYVRTYLDNDPELLIIIKIYFLNSLSCNNGLFSVCGLILILWNMTSGDVAAYMDLMYFVLMYSVCRWCVCICGCTHALAMDVAVKGQLLGISPCFLLWVRFSVLVCHCPVYSTFSCFCVLW